MSEQLVVRVERGAPTAEEIAAVVAVLSARPVAAGVAEAPVSRWWRSGLPAVPGAGSGAWQASGLPR
ncbi:acyl-CoA carboxylase subunit epsilon [Catellatospora sp. NPDC049609]|uniref:acyl-CoA carboxylase subunit epsilon n=1 Tax=Catellatospora sp. NPDC049609 TaxID=3155505 RepID=UPI00342009AB